MGEVIRDEPKKKDKAKGKAAGASLAETQASKSDLTMDMDMMKTRAVYFRLYLPRHTLTTFLSIAAIKGSEIEGVFSGRCEAIALWRMHAVKEHTSKVWPWRH